jgi:Tfp pilus assembly protein PilO
MNFIFPIILIIASFGVFFGYVDPNYKGQGSTDTSNYSAFGIVSLRAELTKYQEIANNSSKIVGRRDVLTKKKNAITNEDRSKLDKLLPNNIDNIRLIIEISDIAAKRNLLPKNISVGDVKKNTDSIGPDGSIYGTISMSFSVNSSYTNFLNFLSDIETNLRLVDITNITFNSTDTGFYDFSVTFNTYWLK